MFWGNIFVNTDNFFRLSEGLKESYIDFEIKKRGIAQELSFVLIWRKIGLEPAIFRSLRDVLRNSAMLEIGKLVCSNLAISITSQTD